MVAPRGQGPVLFSGTQQIATDQEDGEAGFRGR